jgi:plastocyanin
VSIIVTKEGYYPKSLSVFEGEKVKFYVTSTVEEPHCLIVESHKVFVAANKGKVTEAEAVFDKAGEFAFYCPSSKNDGRIVVLKKQTPKREVASESGEKMIWTPREY